MAARLLTALCSFLLLGTISPAQFELPPAISISSWTMEDGLPQNSVAAICQDSTGYLWVATYGGLARFDGRRFEVFDVGNRPDLPSSRFLQVLAGERDDLWVLIENVGLMHYRGDRFSPVPVPSAIRRIVADPGGRHWVISEEGVGRVQGDRIVAVSDRAVRTALETRDGAIWLATMEGSLLRLTGGGERELGTEDGLPGFHFPVLFQDAEGLMWAGNKLGVWRSTDASHRAFRRIEGAPDLVQAIVQDKLGALWFGCVDRLVRWDPDSGACEQVAQGGFVSLFEDRRGNLWNGSTKGRGLQCIRTSPLRDATAALGLTPGDAWAITEGPSGSIAVVHTGQVLELRDGSVERHAFESNTRCALLDRHGDLWVGQSRGLARIRDGERTEYLDEPALKGGVRVLHETREGTLWIGTGTGLSYRDGQDFAALPAEGLINIRSLLQDRTSGALWVGTQQGLARIEGQSVAWLTAADGLSPGSVRTLHQDAQGVLWVGTYGGGLSRIEDGRITRYTKAEGLADNFLACILEDDQERLWISSNRGPFVVHREELNRVARAEAERVACILFTREEGAREANGGNQPSGWRAPDGRLWFPSTEGVLLADPDALPMIEEPPQVRTEAFQVSADRRLDARFTALGYSSPERVRTQYRLLGDGPDWIECVGPREVSYSYLRPGDYEFQVRARNGFGAWSEVLSRPFVVEARLHEQPLFLVGVVLLVGLGAFGLAELRIKAARERAARLERLHTERDRAELELSRSQASLSRLSRELLVTQDKERRRISRELHDDVTQRIAALAMAVEMAGRRLDSDSEQSQEQLHNIAETAQELARDVQQLSRRLHPVGLRTLGLSEAVRQQCEAFTRRTGVEIELTEDVASDEVPEDVAVAAFRIFQESLHNVEKHAGAREVTVRVEIEDGGLLLSIVDAGRGFDSDHSSDAGLGLVTMQERAAAIGGKLTVVSRHGEGTIVLLRAPSP